MTPATKPSRTLGQRVIRVFLITVGAVVLLLVTTYIVAIALYEPGGHH